MVGYEAKVSEVFQSFDEICAWVDANQSELSLKSVQIKGSFFQLGEAKSRFYQILGDHFVLDWVPTEALGSYLKKRKIAKAVDSKSTSHLWVFEHGAKTQASAEELLNDSVVTSFLSLPLSETRLRFLFKQLDVQTNNQLELKKVQYEKNLLIDIGRSLTQVRDLEAILGLILQKAREVTGADAGSVYMVEKDKENPDAQNLRFVLSQNDSIKMESAGFVMPVTPTSIAGASVLRKDSFNIEDLYRLDPPKAGNNPWGFVHDKSFDLKIGYETRSMFTVPLVSARKEVIGVIQLINKRQSGVSRLDPRAPFDDQVTAFDQESVEVAHTLASQAGIALENALLYDEVKTLFEGFVHASVSAIESRDPTTSGHSERVALFTLGLAKATDKLESGAYEDISFSKDQYKQIEYAALLHDFGKVGVRENVLVKPKKLYPHEQTHIRLRFDYIRQAIRLDQNQKKLKYLLESSRENVMKDLNALDSETEEKLKEMDELIQFIFATNEPTVLEKSGSDRVKDIAKMQYQDEQGIAQPFLRDNEVISLQIARGSLTQEERVEIESHVVHTTQFLEQIPWGNSFQDIPLIASTHHEKLDGSGYPHGLKDKEIPLPAKMMTISDIYDALTASDRPYKKAVPVEKALDILGYEVKAGKLEKKLLDIFIEAEVYKLSLSG